MYKDVMHQIKYILIIAFIFSFVAAADLFSKSDEMSAITGDWAGFRNLLIEKGIRTEIVYNGEVFSNVLGGVRKKAEYLDIMDFNFTFDLEKLWGWKDGTFLFDILGIHGGNPSNHVGDTQGVSNIAAPNTWQLYEAWIQQNLFSDKLSFLIGIHDLNTEFDVIETARLFLNSSHGIGSDFSQCGENSVSIFPTTTLGVRAKAQLSQSLLFQITLFDGRPENPDNRNSMYINLEKKDGVLLASELTYSFGKDERIPLLNSPQRNKIRRRRFYLRRGKYHGKFSKRRERQNRSMAVIRNADVCSGKFTIGGWYNTGNFDVLSNEYTKVGPSQLSRNWGIYASFEQTIFNKKKDPPQGFSYFFRIGTVDEKVNRFDAYCGGGVVYVGLLPKRHKDQIGLAVAAVHNNRSYKNTKIKEGIAIDDWEVNLELTYQAHIAEYMSFQPDVQHIINPGTNALLKDALAVGLRIEILF